MRNEPAEQTPATDDPGHTAVRSRLWARVAYGIFTLVLAAGLYRILTQGELRGELVGLFGGAGESLRAKLFDQFLFNPWFHVIAASILLLEVALPARREQPLISRGLLVDALWLVVAMLFALAAPAYVLITQQLFEAYLPFLRIDALAAWPPWARFVTALLVSDFVHYAGHLVRHRVPAFWFFHAIHHSQKELNMFTENRIHPFDVFIRHVMTFVPILMVEPSAPNIVAIVWIRFWHVRLVHANVRSNFGILRYVLVTPQSHRVHHSSDPEHQNHNFGITFSLWDHLFGTQLRDYDVYPDCGVDDPAFPFEQDGHPLSALGKQLMYPFAKLAEGARLALSR